MNDKQPDPATEDEQPSRRGALIALGVVALLVVGGIVLSYVLHGTGQIQDCVMAGRSNCAPIQR